MSFSPTTALLGHVARVALLLGVCALIGLAGLATNASADDGSAPSYSTGEQGSQLQWLPYRPSEPKLDPNVRRTAHTVEPLPPVADREPTRARRDGASTLPAISEVPRLAARLSADRGSVSPFNDPFGDRDAPSRQGAELLAQQRDLLQPPMSGREYGGALPPLDANAIPERSPIPIDDPTAPGSRIPMPGDRFAPRAPDSLQAPDVAPRQPTMPPREPAREDVPTEDPMRIESELRGQPTSKLPPKLEAAEDVVRREADLTLKCISPEDFRPVTEITTDITPQGEKLPNECPLTDTVFDLEQARPWTPITYTWKASGLCHKPLYFEEAQLERYGHSWGPYVQPFISGAHFFLTVPVLPYKMGLKAPTECVYSLGYYRPGNCAPYMLDPIPLSVRAGLAQAGAWVGGIYMIP